jgi:hypothetical protein
MRHLLSAALAALVVWFAAGAEGFGQAAPAAALPGTWEWRGEGFVLTLAVDPDGTGKLDAAPIRWSVRGETLAIVEDGETIEYRFSLAGDALTLSGGDLDAPALFQRKGAAPPRGIGARKAQGGHAKPGDDWGDAPQGSASVPPAPQASPAGLEGAWELRSERGFFRLVLEPGGAGFFDATPLRWSSAPGTLRIVMNGATVDYAVVVAGESLTLSGGDLAQPATFARAAARPGPAREAGGIAGAWEGEGITVDFRADGSLVMGGQILRYATSGATLTITGPRGAVQGTYRVEGDALTITCGGQTSTYRRVAATGGAPGQPPQAATPAMAEAAGVWVAQESSLDPQFYMSYTQYVILYPDGTVGYEKAEGGASRSAVTEHLERFRSWRTGRQGTPGGNAGRWETDGAAVTVHWRLWNGLVSRGQVDAASGTMTLTGMGALEEGATLTFKREQ